MSTYPWPNPSTTSQGYLLGSNQPQFKPLSFNEDAARITFMSVALFPENEGKSIEEIRWLDYNKRKYPNSNFGVASSFGHNSITPSRYNLTQNAFSSSNTSRPWTNDVVMAEPRSDFSYSTTARQNTSFPSTTKPISSFGNQNSSFLNAGRQSSFPQSSGFPDSSSSGLMSQSTFSLQSNNPFAGNNTSGFAQNTGGFSGIPNATPANPFAGSSQNNPFNRASASTGNYQNPFASSLGQTGMNNNNLSTTSNPFSRNNNSGGMTSPFFAPTGQANPGNPANPFSSTNSLIAPTAFSSGSSLSGANPFSSNNPVGPTNPYNNIGGGSNFGLSTTGNPFSSSANPFPLSTGLGSGNLNPFSAPLPSASVFQPSPFYPSVNGAFPQAYQPSQLYSFADPNSTNQNFNNFRYMNPPSLTAAFKDPHGLSWVFPDRDPEKLLKEYKGKRPIKQHVSFTQRIARNKSPNEYSKEISNKFGNMVRNRSKETRSKLNIPFKQHEKFQFEVKENFKDIRYVEVVDEGVKRFKRNETEKKKSESALIELKVFIGKEDYKLALEVDSNIIVRDLIEQLQCHVQADKPFKLVFNERKLRLDDSLENQGVKHNDWLFLVYEEENSPQELLPIIKKFKSKPSLEEMKHMCAEELKCVKDFTLQNEYGMIVFEGETDVRGLNVDQCLSIGEKNVVGFNGASEEERENMDQRLNKPAVVTFFNVKPGKNKGKFEIKLRIMCENNQSQFIKYDEENEQLTFKINQL